MGIDSKVIISPDNSIYVGFLQNLVATHFLVLMIILLGYVVAVACRLVGECFIVNFLFFFSYYFPSFLGNVVYPSSAHGDNTLEIAYSESSFHFSLISTSSTRFCAVSNCSV